MWSVCYLPSTEVYIGILFSADVSNISYLLFMHLITQTSWTERLSLVHCFFFVKTRGLNGEGKNQTKIAPR